MLKNKIRRNALIIQNPGEASDFRQGVLHDVERFCKFLTSNAGGGWENNEITVMPADCTVDGIEEYFNRTSSVTDYYLILFTGHGSYREDSGPICWLMNGEGFTHSWLEEKVAGVPTLFLTDSCQGIDKFNEGGKIKQRTFSSVTDSTDRQSYRRVYDDKLRNLPGGMFVVGSSVSPGEYAKEDPKAGGYYLISLLSEANKINKDSSAESGVYGIAYIHMLASEKVETLSKGRQTPYLEGYNRSFQPPFMVKL
ncbi:MAG: caspase family protein [Muribaculaceae bacterium]|nr:caspase family protein [Muribaculaceae bacterium]